MSEAAKTEKYLIAKLKKLSVEKDAILGILLSLEAKEQQLEMLEFLVSKEEISQEKILSKVAEIAPQE